MEKSQEDLHQQQDDIALQGRNMVSLFQDQEMTNRQNLPNSAGRTTRENSSYKASKRPEKSAGNQSLVVQMYSHMQAQRKLEQQKNHKIARTDRKRQKIKRELEAASSLASPLLNTFGGSWTQCRLLKTPQSARPEEEPSDGQNVSDASDSGREPGQQHGSAQPDTERGSEAVRFQPDTHGHVESFDGQLYEIMDSNSSHAADGTGEHPPHQSASATYPASPSHPCHRQRALDSATSRGVSTYKSQKPTTHILKDPGKIQIRFSTSPSPHTASRHAARGLKHTYQWDAMPAGSLASVQSSYITLDGSLL